MIKVLSFTRRKAGASRDDFEAYWRSIHVPMWAAVPEIRGYVASRPLATVTRSDVPAFGMADFDGLVELWYDDEASMARSAGSAAGQAWRADSALFIGGMRSFLTREQTAVPFARGQRPPIKALSIVRRRRDQAAADFQQYWSKVHAPMASDVPGLDGFVLSKPIRPLPRQDIPSIEMEGEPDGFTSSFVQSIEARERMASSPEAKRWFADGATFLGAVRTFILEEDVILAPPPSAGCEAT